MVRREAFQLIGSLGDEIWKLSADARTRPLSRSEHGRLRFFVARVPEQRRLQLLIHVIRPIGTENAQQLLEDLIDSHSGDRVERTVVKRARQMLEQFPTPSF